MSVLVFLVDFQFQSVSKNKLHFCSRTVQLEMLFVCHFGNAVVNICTFHIPLVFEPLTPSTNKISFVQKEA